MTTNPGHYHNFPPSPSYISDDSEDHYGGSETDDPHPSSDSELVSHPSDNEDTPSPQHYDSDDTDDDVDDGDDDDSHGLTGEQDAFLFVDPSDLDATSSRPPSALSHHSNHDPMKFVYPSMTLSQEQECERDRRASLPPSMPPSLPPVSTYNYKDKDNEDDDVQELVTTSSTATLTASREIGTVATANEKMEQPDSHDPSTAHDIPTTLDSSLETISGQQQQQLSTEPSNNHRPQEQCNIGDDEQVDDSTKDNGHYCHQSAYDNNDSEHDTYTPPPPRTVQYMPNPAVTSFTSRPRVPRANNDHQMAARVTDQDPSGGGNEPLDRSTTDLQVHATIKSPIDCLSASPTKTEIPTPPMASGSPSPERNFIRTLATFTRLAGLVSLVIVGGCLALEFYYRSLQPAHVALSATGVTYADDHRLAVVNLDVYSSRLRQERHLSRSPGFHARVLNHNSPWSLQDAHYRPLYLFANPIVVCPDGGSCQVYIASLQERHKKNASPWLCHDTGYYVHLWFANGTRIPLSPPEIFTTRGKSDRKPLACLSPATFIGSHRDKDSSIQEDDGNDDYLAYWKERWQQMSGTVSNRFSNKSQIAVYWDPFQPVLARARAMVHAVVTYYSRATDKVTHILLELKGRLACVDTRSNNRLPSTLDRARSNAKGFQTRMTSKLRNLGDQIPLMRSKQDRARRQAKISMEEQARAFKKTVEDQFDSITTDKILRVADEVLSVAEASLEAILDTEAIKDLAKTMRADEIKRATERAILKTEEQLDAILHSELARQVNRDLQRLVDDFKATPAGGKIVQEAQDMQSDAKRYIRSLQRKFRLIRLAR
ncbi:hypothetical protein BGZ95_005971 [Linnemannia exigua]|uniref:Uncharacterized protein n=1 Tax=Linnemannia exigua TaxID=604196 RepID=A0AAD4H8H0_9FUNG|nr:hypothetical protein BGZ95_005971 [Linnemannia exigua]